MDLEAQRLDALEQELRRDLDAITRVKKMMAFKNGSLSVLPDERQMALPVEINLVTEDRMDMQDGPVIGTSIRGTIEGIMNRDPEVRWTVQRMLKHLTDIGFSLKATKPIFSVGQAMKRLAESKRIRVVYKGVGSEPNVYKGLMQPKEKETEVHSVDHAQVVG